MTKVIKAFFSNNTCNVTRQFILNSSYFMLLLNSFQTLLTLFFWRIHFTPKLTESLHLTIMIIIKTFRNLKYHYLKYA